MTRTLEVKISPDDIENLELIKKRIAQKLPDKIKEFEYKLLRKSVDARGKSPHFVLRVEVSDEPIADDYHSRLSQLQILDEKSPTTIIVGAGPAGYFAALELLEQGIRPIVLERGKDVRARRRDLRAIQQFGEVNPHSNYCFGEGGAGTYSDGKLYTRSHKRGSIIKVLELLVEHGATSDILIDAHPHIGSNKLPKIVANIRQTIEYYGGEIHFDSHVTDFILEGDKISGVLVNDEIAYSSKAVILATGHSARDIFLLLEKNKILIEAKPFALGVRIEHPQPLIDAIQYRQAKRHHNLPASSYTLTCQADGRGVFSFCMCPGGLIVPASTAPEELVVNGMSLSRRDSPFANSGTVVAVELEDLKDYQSSGVFAGMAFQSAVEQAMFKAGDGTQQAPAQRMVDFVRGKVSSSLPSTSYIPGIHAAPLHDLLPSFIYDRLKQGVLEFSKKMKGYYTQEAVVVGTESRTSSPIRIPRKKETCMHPQIKGLFPCGEGAGYAGGIVSAAMDGQRVANAVSRFYEVKN